MKKYDAMFCGSLMALGLSNLVIACSNIFEFGLPDIVSAVLCLLGVIAAAVLIYSSVKKMFGKGK